MRRTVLSMEHGYIELMLQRNMGALNCCYVEMLILRNMDM